MDTGTTQSEVVCPTAAAIARENFQRTWPRCMRTEDLLSLPTVCVVALGRCRLMGTRARAGWGVFGSQ